MGVTTNPIPVKAALNMLGHRVGGLRLPLVEADEDERAAVRAVLERHGLLQTAGADVANGTLRVLPLGGLGEIGKNMTVVEYDGRIVVVDVGLRFPTAEMVGIDLVLPDFAYLRERVDDIEGDRRHPRPRGPPRRAALGPARAGRSTSPVYGGPLTMAMARSKLDEHRLKEVDVEDVDDRRARFELGPVRRSSSST